MSVFALIQDQHPVLNATSAAGLVGFEKQVYTRFYETLEEDSGFVVQRAPTLEAYQALPNLKPAKLVVCVPIPPTGNAAPGLGLLGRIMDAFPSVPVLVWSERSEASLKKTCLEMGAYEYYSGSLLQAPEDLADYMLKVLKR